MAAPVPIQKATPEETFGSLADSFEFDKDKLLPALLGAKLKNLSDFRFFFITEDDVSQFIAKVTDLDDALLNAARLRAAWHAVRLQFVSRESDKSKVDVAELDDLLVDEQLQDAKKLFWWRHKLRFPAEIMPADTLISRVSREMSKRMLMVFNLYLVKTLV